MGDSWCRSFYDCNIAVTLYYLPTATNGWTNPSGGRPALLWNPAFSAISNLAGVVSGVITGTPTIPVAVEACTNLSMASWVRLQTTNLVDGTCQFADPDANAASTRFYRIVGP
jgi:hypothetical protein